MIETKFHVELAGKKYTLAEDSEGTHYQRIREPLRAPSTGFILGDANKFNLRPDLIEWAMTDWSGGEGSHVYSDEEANGYSVGYNIDPLTEYGTLRLSYLAEQMSVIGGPLGQSSLVTARDKLYLIDWLATGVTTGSLRVWEYDYADSLWRLADSDAVGSVISAGFRGAWGDSTHMFVATGASDLKRWDGTNFVLYTATGVHYVLGAVGGYVYTLTLATGGANIHEVLMAGTTPVAATLIHSLSELKDPLGISNPKRFMAVTGGNCLYLSVNVNLEETVLWKFVPTTAADPGFGTELIRIPGFRALAIMYNFGILYLAGLEGEVPVVFYYDEVNGTYGATYRNTKRPTNHPLTPSVLVHEMGGGNSAQFSKSHFVMIGSADVGVNDGNHWQMMTVDALTGAVVGGTVIRAGTPFGSLTAKVGHHDMAVWRDRFFIDLVSPVAGQGGVSQVWQLRKDFYTTEVGIMDSSVNDFGLIDEKILASIALTTDPLPPGCSVTVKFQINQDGVWHTAGVHDVDGATQVTLDHDIVSGHQSFRNIQIRLELRNGAGQNIYSPVVRNLRIRSTVVKGVLSWKLILNATDELGAMQNRAWNGETLINNIVAAADSEGVVSFKDGYSKRGAGDFTEYDVVVDDYSVINDRPGEGVVHVSLREVD